MPSSSGERHLGVHRHVDRVRPGGAEPERLGAGREARALDDDAGAGRRERLALRLERAATAAARSTGSNGSAATRCCTDALDVEEGVGAAPGAVDELVGDDHGARRVLGADAADGRRRHDGLRAERRERPDVRAEVDEVRRHRVALAVPGEERDGLAAQLADRHLARGRAVGRLDDVARRRAGREERVEAGAADDGDVDAGEAEEDEGRRRTVSVTLATLPTTAVRGTRAHSRAAPGRRPGAGGGGAGAASCGVAASSTRPASRPSPTGTADGCSPPTSSPRSTCRPSPTRRWTATPSPPPTPPAPATSTWWSSTAIPAGRTGPALRPGTAAPIMTGAAVPEGAVAVVPIERADPARVPRRREQRPRRPAGPRGRGDLRPRRRQRRLRRQRPAARPARC